MKHKVLVFGASTSRKSINKQLAYFAARQLEGVRLNLIDLNDYEMPIFNVDREIEDGIPDKAHEFKKLIKQTDGILISFAEHNGSYSAAFKNILDWISRIEKSTWHRKPMLLLATSPGGRGAQNVLKTASARVPFNDGVVVATFSLPFFKINFDKNKGIIDEDLRKEFETALDMFKQALSETEDSSGETVSEK